MVTFKEKWKVMAAFLKKEINGTVKRESNGNVKGEIMRVMVTLNEK